jgi:hypothetical protein
LRYESPEIAAWAISRSTRLRQTSMPCAIRSSAWIRAMDSWAWEQLDSWRQLRTRFPVGPFFCVIHGPTAVRTWEPSSVRRQLAQTAAAAGVRGRFAPTA